MPIQLRTPRAALRTGQSAWQPGAVLAICTLCCACSDNPGAREVTIGVRPAAAGATAPAASSVEPHAGRPNTPVPGASQPSATDQSFRVRVEDRRGLAVEFITLKCAGECAEVQAVARGGNPPYTFAWQDGSRDAQRRVCLTATDMLRVTATDTGIPTPEFEYEARSASAALTIEVLHCEVPPPAGGMCLQNPSIEGVATFNVVGNFEAPPWVSCEPFQGADVWDVEQPWHVTPPPARDGMTYARMFASEPSRWESISERLCAPLSAGRTYHMRLDLAARPFLADEVPGYIELWGGAAECATEELLGTSPPGESEWRTHCLAFTPKTELTTLTLRPRADYGTGIVFVDNLSAAEGCP